ncbi:MAG TPA: methylenetetrahydrofolate reductase [Candidatus Syntrophoarchaeum butanivorans]|uniref:Methylenetetrahydrofolate reductase n=2 Tax=Candidatus Syntropharchaeum butanivorans TaxID=1839936 RepID=A0A7J2S0V6_9EURY|nr:methylenetetrahydrofolate reductase [Candidatus Syntrophoarchaeum butanivorans]
MTEAYSDLMRNIKEGKFVFTGELEPEKTTDLTELVESAKKLLGHCVACNVTDNPQSMAYMSSLVASYVVQRDAGMECVYQLRCSDRNSIALTSDLLGAGALGIKNVLALTGDHTTLGDYPGAKPVFDLDSGQLVYLIRKMVDEGVDLYGRPIHNPPKFHVGVAGNPNADPLESEILKLKRKIDAGAEFIQTQVIFDIEVAKTFLKEMERFKVPVLIGIFPLKNYGTADYFDKYIPGVHVPKDLLAEMKKASEISDKEKRNERYDEINLEYYGDFVHEIAHTTSAAGIHVMAVAYERITPALIERAKI